MDYLGKEESNLTINFSRPGSQVGRGAAARPASPHAVATWLASRVFCLHWRRCASTHHALTRLASPCPALHQIVAQYYNFIRLGKDGFRRVFDNLYIIYNHLVERLEATGGRRGCLPVREVCAPQLCPSTCMASQPLAAKQRRGANLPATVADFSAHDAAEASLAPPSLAITTAHPSPQVTLRSSPPGTCPCWPSA